MVVTKDRTHGPGRSVSMFIVGECEDHLAIQAPQIINDVNEIKYHSTEVVHSFHTREMLTI